MAAGGLNGPEVAAGSLNGPDVAAGGVGDHEVAAALLVIAKAPLAGRAKTRLCPPLAPADAARVADACLLDTLDEASAVAARRHVLVFDGDPTDWRPGRWDVMAQRGGPLGERLANAFTDVPGPAVVIAMDTPQVTAASLHRALAAVTAPATAVLGLTDDGGYWALGLPADRDADAVFDGIPMSTAHTGEAQRRRLSNLGYRVVELETLRDIDEFADLVAVAPLIPQRRVGRLVADLSEQLLNRTGPPPGGAMLGP